MRNKKQNSSAGLIKFECGSAWCRQIGLPFDLTMPDRWSRSHPFVNPSLPITIVRLGQWWEALAHGVTFYMPNQFGQGFVESEDHKSSGEMVLVNDATNAMNVGVLKFNLRLRSRDANGLPVELESEADAFGLKGKRAVIRIVQARVTKVDQTTFHELFKDWKAGRFDETFRDLSIATRDLESLGVEHARNRLDDESKAAKGSEHFEIFGVKIPAPQLTRWGILGLLCVQLYFFVHLKQLSNKLHSSDAGWDIPWLGMYASPLPRVIYFVSITVVPVVAVGLLAAQMFADLVSISGVSWNWELSQDTNRWPVFTIILCSLASLTSALLGCLAWKYRPKLNSGRRSHPFSV